MRRRRFLATVAAAATVGLAGCGGREDDDPPPPGPGPHEQPEVPARTTGEESRYPAAIASEWGFDEVVNLGTEGADQTGARETADYFEDHLRDGTLVYLPPGRYELGRTVSVSDASTGIVGENATIVPPDGYDGTLFALGYPEPLSEVLIAGLTFDFRAEDTGARPLFAMADDRIVARELDVRGRIDVGQDQLRFDVTEPDGTARVENVRLPDGGVPGTGVTGMEVGDQNHGDLAFVDCHVAGFPDNGLYANPPEGEVSVLGGSYLNNGISGVRIETKDASVVRGVHVRCDDRSDAGENMRGIRLRSGESLLVEDCLVEMLEVTSSDGGIVFSSELGSATVQNCQVRVDADDVNAVRIKAPGDSTAEDAHHGPFRCENVVVTGEATGGAAVAAANRRGCEFANLCVHQPGDDRDGIVAEDVTGEVHDSYVSVTGDPLSFTGSAISQRNVTVNRDPRDADSAVDRWCSQPSRE
ncbi:hypothetical protein [Halobacterium rubrum]|uniref:hypothetical protein n=1 Tax=Halobacterium TaxID=2239 RepID=UPI001F304EF1|nr:MULTISPECIES: hypothetical protein [Halobacterium]MDH5021290.1 hypothetical protein [Halobacterium rubrum]